MSMNLAMVDVQQQVSLSLLKETMDFAESSALKLVAEMTPQTPPPSATEGQFINMLI